MRVPFPSRIIALLVALSLVPPAAAAGVTGIGLKGGLSIATLHGRLPTDGLVENSSKLGFGGGVWLTLPLGGGFSLQPELNYAAKGTSFGKIDLTDSFGTVVGTAEVLEVVGYFELPLLVRVSAPNRRLASPYLLAGPVVGVRLSQQLRLTGVLSAGSDIDHFRSVDVGVAVGTGLELGRGQVRGVLEGRYTLGLTPATEDIYSGDARNGALLLTMGLALRR